MHIIKGDEFGVDFVQKVIDFAIQMKSDKSKIPDLSGKAAGFLFFNESLRTRLSFTIGAQKMKMAVACENMGNMYKFALDKTPMDGDKPEHIQDAARVISRYCDVIGIRNSAFIGGGKTELPEYDDLIKDIVITSFAKYSTKPIINMESDMYHPMQGFADAMTIQEKLGAIEGKKVVLTYAPHIKNLPIATPQSQLLTPALLGAQVVLAAPKGFTLSDECMQKISQYCTNFEIQTDQDSALKNADVVIAKSWLNLTDYKAGVLQNGQDYYNTYRSWMLDNSKMSSTNNALFMHCMPLRRDIEVGSDVVDSRNSVIIDEAENRMWTQMSVINKLLSNI